MLLGDDLTTIAGTFILALPAIISAVLAGLVHRNIRTPSGKSIGEVAEYAHDTSIANNMLLRKHNGPTKPLDREQARLESETPPQVPVSQAREHG